MDESRATDGITDLEAQKMFLKPNAELERMLAYQPAFERDQESASAVHDRVNSDQACGNVLSDKTAEQKLEALRHRVGALRAEIMDFEKRVAYGTPITPFFNYFWLSLGGLLLLLGAAGAGGGFWLFGILAVIYGAFNLHADSCRKAELRTLDERLNQSREGLRVCREEIGELEDERRVVAEEIAAREAAERKRELAKQEKVAAQRREEAIRRRKEAEQQIAQKRQTLEYWLGLDGHKFEREFASLLEQNGWKAKVTKASGDGGIDIVATSPTLEKTAIQCKRWKNRVGAPYVRDLKGAASVGGFDRMIVVGTGGFTTDAESFAVIAGVELWDKDSLYSLISASK